MAQCLEDKRNVLSRNSPARCRISVVTVRNELRRLCFYTCVSVHRGWVCLSAGIPSPREQRPPGEQTTPRQQALPPGSRRLLLRTVRILLECILVLVLFTEHLRISTVSPEMSPWHLKILFGVVCIADKLSIISSNKCLKDYLFEFLENCYHVAASPGADITIHFTSESVLPKTQFVKVEFTRCIDNGDIYIRSRFKPFKLNLPIS